MYLRTAPHPQFALRGRDLGCPCKAGTAPSQRTDLSGEFASRWPMHDLLLVSKSGAGARAAGWRPRGKIRQSLDPLSQIPALIFLLSRALNIWLRDSCRHGLGVMYILRAVVQIPFRFWIHHRWLCRPAAIGPCLIQFGKAFLKTRGNSGAIFEFCNNLLRRKSRIRSRQEARPTIFKSRLLRGGIEPHSDSICIV